MMGLAKKLVHKVLQLLKKIYINITPCKNIIIFESVPDLSDNTKAVFDEMINRGLNKKYQMIWLVKEKNDSLPEIDNVIYLNLNDKNDYRKYRFAYMHAKCLVCCNGFLVPVKSSQISFYLSHGTAIKSVRSYYTVPEKIQYFLAAAPGVVQLQSYEFNVNEEKIFALGFPRNDELSERSLNLKQYFNGDFEKVVVWYPTFRQHKLGAKTGASNALPIIYNEENAKQLNEAAKESKVLIVLKPHFAQDVSYVKDIGLSNIQFIDDNFFVEKGMSSYKFVGSSDALITDYSSIYFDYTICDKPVAAIWEDIEEYKKKPGLINDYEYYMSGAEKVYCIDDLIGFIQRVGDNIDELGSERRKICNIANYSNSGGNSQRVVDFIVEKAKL